MFKGLPDAMFFLYLLAGFVLLILFWIVARIVVPVFFALNSEQAREVRRKAKHAEALREEAGEYIDLSEAARQRGDQFSEIRYKRLAAGGLAEAGNKHMALEMYASVYAKEGDYIKAATTLEETINLLPSGKMGSLRGGLLSQQASHYRMAGWFTKAHESAVGAVKAIERSEEYPEEDSSFPIDPNDVMNAMEWIAAARAEPKPSLTLALRQAAQLSANRFLFDEAHHYAARLQEKSHTAREQAQARSTIGFVLQYQGRLADALAIYEELTVNDPDSPQSYFMAAGVLSHMGRWEECVLQCNQALDRNASTSGALRLKNAALYHLVLARVKIEQGFYAEAQQLLESAMPAYPPPHRINKHCKGLLLLIRAISNREPAAIVEETKVILAETESEMAAFPERSDAIRCYVDILQILGQVLYETGDVEGCYAITERVTVKDLLPGEQPSYHYWRGLCLEQKREKEGAKAAYTAAATCGTEERHVKLAREKLIGLDATA